MYSLCHWCTTSLLTQVQAPGLFQITDDSLSSRHPLHVAFFTFRTRSVMWNDSVSSYISYSHQCSSLNSITMVHLWIWWCGALLLQAKSSLKLRQLPWDKKGWRVIVIVTTHSHQEDDNEEDGNGHGVVCSLSYVTLLSDLGWPRLSTPQYSFDIVVVLAFIWLIKAKYVLARVALYRTHGVWAGQKVTYATCHLCVDCEF